MKSKIKKYIIYFVLLYFIQIIILVILEEFKVYKLPYAKGFDTNNNLFIFKTLYGFDLKMKLKHLYIYYFITYFYLTLVHTGLIFFCSIINKYSKKVIVYLIGMLLFSFLYYFFHAIIVYTDLERILWFYLDALLYYHIYTISIFMFVNLIFSILFFNLKSKEYDQRKISRI